jgi:Flp pilus assembly protein TadG
MILAMTRVRRLARRFLAKSGGTAAIEFALIAMPFFSLMMAIFETTVIYFASTTLEDATDVVGRMIRTGQAQEQGLTASQFKQLICNQVNMFLSCDGRLVVDVRSFPDFQDVSFPPPLDANGDLNNNTQFQPGAAGNVVIVRVFYTWKVITPVLGATLSNMSGGDRLLTAVTAFRNEPFGS